MKEKILYLSYNGMLEPLGTSQVLGYLHYLNDEFEFHLISLEKENINSDAIIKLKNSLEKKGIFYYPIEYKKGKIVKNFNIIKLLIKTNSIIRKEKIYNIHCRSYLPTFVSYLLKKIYPQINYLFDTRGFGFDEKADVRSISRNGFIFKSMKKLEKKLYLSASGINMLSQNSKKVILNQQLFETNKEIPPITVIPTCVDLDKFPFHHRTFDSPITIGYVGNTIGWYDFDKTLKVIKKIETVRDYKFLIFNNDQHDFIKSKLNEYQISKEKVTIENVAYEDMPDRLKEIDLSIFFIKPLFSKKASAATKLGELLASGIPVITNAEVGDHEYFIEHYKAGKIINFDKIHQYNFESILNNILNIETSITCRDVAEEYFSVEKGVNNYKKLYSKIFNFK